MKRILYVLILILAFSILYHPVASAFELNGFADVSFTKSTEGADEFRNGDFAFGTLDLYLAQSLEKVDILAELIVEFGDVLDLERLHLGYTFSDALKVQMGRFHTPLGFWNTAYHHGVEIQPTILRPEFLNFEDDAGILPTHTVGVHVFGKRRTTIGKIEYGVLFGNGEKIRSEDGTTNTLFPNNIGDNDVGKSIGAYGILSPVAVTGLRIGVSLHQARVQSDNSVKTSPVDVDQTIIGGAATYAIENIGLAGEYFSIRNEDNSGGSDTSDVYYGLITYTYRDRWIPYLMYEDMSVNENASYFKTLGVKDVTRTTVGLRYNLSYRSSLKGEIRTVDKDNNDWNEYAFQWALAF